jgi:putative RNA 2'-phosphotransferase
MNQQRIIRVSKYLRKYLRHQPEHLGLTLAPGGWVAVDELLAACAHQNFPISRDELADVVATNDKQRFAFDPSGTRIRANQGHSVTIDLGLEPLTPPDTLYHGTGHRAVASILREGLHRMSRHHVHLSKDIPTARKVGSRHGRPSILAVDTAAMHRDGYAFFCSANGVWLVDHVPPSYLRLVAEEEPAPGYPRRRDPLMKNRT